MKPISFPFIKNQYLPVVKFGDVIQSEYLNNDKEQFCILILVAIATSSFKLWP